MAIAQYISHFSPQEIRSIFHKARRTYVDAGLVILTYPTAKQFGRILVITSRKTGNAPERNKIRRRIKAIFYQKKYYTHLLDCLIIVKKPGINYDFSKLQEILAQTFLGTMIAR